MQYGGGPKDARCKLVYLDYMSKFQSPGAVRTQGLDPSPSHARICTHFEDPPSPHACVRTYSTPPLYSAPF